MENRSAGRSSAMLAGCGAEKSELACGEDAPKSASAERRLDPSRPWPELLYRFVEHYRWEPHHLCLGQPIEAFHRRIRRQEVPLNYVLDVLLALLSPDTIRSLLVPFGLPEDCLEGEVLRPCFPLDVGYTQPDVSLLSDRCRAFIELKWNASVVLRQVQKYLLLHADLDASDGPRQPFLLFLTRDEFWRAWRPRDEICACADPGPLLKSALSGSPLPNRLAVRATGEAYQAIVDGMTYGFATWAKFADHLADKVLPQLETSGRIAEHAAVTGFAADLQRRLSEG